MMLLELDAADLALLAAAGYVAVSTLTRLMVQRREQLLEAFKDQMHSGPLRTNSPSEKKPASGGRNAA